MIDYLEISKLLRYYILLSSTTALSGHPTSSLSAADLMSVLWFGGLYKYDFSKPENLYNDRLIFSKGHASSLLYALYKLAGVISTTELKQYRTPESILEGHPTPRIPWVDFSTGSLGMGLSYGLGMAMALPNTGVEKSPNVFVLIGDGELAEGQNWEAMQLASHYQRTNLIGLLDVNGLGQSTQTMYKHDLQAFQGMVSSCGWETVIIDGHNHDEITRSYQHINSPDRKKPLMIIAKTIKGYGVETFLDGKNWHSKTLTAEESAQATTDIDPQILEHTFEVSKPAQYQAVSQNQHFSLDSKNIYSETNSTKAAFGQTLASLAKNNKSLIVLDGDVGNSTGTAEVKTSTPNQYLNCYIAEQNMVSMAVGYAKMGYRPVVSTFAAFLTRAYDQLRMANLSFANLLINGAYAGVSIGKDGFSQMGIEDIAMLRALPNTTILYPSDATQTQILTELLLNNSGLSYIRTTREPTPPIYNENDTFTIGGSKTLRSSEHDQCAIIAAGITLHEALKAHHILAQDGIAVRIIDLYSIQPIDKLTLFQATHDCPYGLLTVEDHAIQGGLGDAVLDAFTDIQESLPRLTKLGVKTFPHSATPAQNLTEHGLSAEMIVAKVRSICQNIINT